MNLTLTSQYRYQPYDETEEQPLFFVVASQESLHAAIMWSSYGGVCLDSSWRHKNENVAPLTFLVTVDTNHKMVPSKFHLM